MNRAQRRSKSAPQPADTAANLAPPPEDASDEQRSRYQAAVALVNVSRLLEIGLFPGSAAEPLRVSRAFIGELVESAVEQYVKGDG